MKKPAAAALATVLVGGTLAALAHTPVASAASSLTSCTSSSAAIYTAPTKKIKAPLGAILACRTTKVSMSGFSDNNPYTAAQVQYVTTSVTGAKEATTGMIIIPTLSGGAVPPILAFSPGTIGDAPKCAMSLQLSGQMQDGYEGGNIGAYVNAGFAVAVSDGLGYMTGQVHHYVTGLDNGKAELDAVRAAMNLPGGNLPKNDKVGITGYSEGGHISLWAAQFASSYAPDLNVVGDASGGIPGDLKVTAASLDGGPFAGFLAATLVGLHETYPKMPFTSLLNNAGRQAIVTISTNCLAGTLANFVGAHVTSFTTQGLTLDQLYALSGPNGTYGSIIDNEKLGVNIGNGFSSAKWKVPFPVLQYMGLADEVIPQSTETATHVAYCNAHIPTRWNTYPGDHVTADSQAYGDIVSWFKDRFAGKVELGNC